MILFIHVFKPWLEVGLDFTLQIFSRAPLQERVSQAHDWLLDWMLVLALGLIASIIKVSQSKNVIYKELP